MVPAVAKKVKGEVMTSSPAPMSKGHQRQQQRIGAGRDADSVRAAQ